MGRTATRGRQRPGTRGDHTSFWLEHKLWGLNPVGYHAVNILLHLVNCLLLQGDAATGPAASLRDRHRTWW